MCASSCAQRAQSVHSLVSVWIKRACNAAALPAVERGRRASVHVCEQSCADEEGGGERLYITVLIHTLHKRIGSFRNVKIKLI